MDVEILNNMVPSGPNTLIPEWLFNFANKVIFENNMDSSHDQLHFINTAKYAYKIVNSSEIKNKEYIIKDFDFIDSEEIIVLSAYCHDLIDSKYMDEEKGIKNLKDVFINNGYSESKLNVIFYIITHISFSKRRKREKEGLPLFEEHAYKFASQIVCDADQLDAYRVERIISYQNTKGLSDLETKQWCKTILVKRILKYIEKYMNTKIAKTIAQDMHDKVQEIVNTEYIGVEMMDY